MPNAEEGATVVQELLPEAVISTVNLAEVIARLAAFGMPEADIRVSLSLLGLENADFDLEQAYQTGLLYPLARSLGPSLGDRACLALARVHNATAVTADRAWQDLNASIEIKLIR